MTTKEGLIIKEALKKATIERIEKKKQLEWVKEQNEKLTYLNEVLIPLGIEYIGEDI